MKITVVSDTHRNFNALNDVVSQNLDSDLFIHLGDGQNEFFDVASSHPDKNFIIVKGNRDYGELDEEKVVELDGCKIYCNHGYDLEVEVSLDNLLDKAGYHECKIALFGHTHAFKTEFINGIYVMNPGSLESPRGKSSPTYGVIEISENSEIVMNIMEYKPNA